ncbi:uncharacterized protein [Palaemon carinicauda]|uniref:uncharacterized protein isoform X2 n=1 Tax=Palaemon carinicauda TaxID=392227 RepID=UPI0035B66956
MAANFTNASGVGEEEKSSEDEKSSEFTWINTHLRIYYLLVIAITGIIGNFISMAVFLGTRLKNHSSYYYLAFMGASDTLFLSFLCVQCLLNNQGLQWLRIEFLSSSAGCKMINYVMSTCTNISVWLTVAYTTERCIAVQYPLLRAQLCTVGRAKMVTAIVTISNTIANLYVFPTVGRPPSFDNCGYFEEYLQLIRVVSVVDALVMMALPFVLIVCMNSMIVWKLWKLSDVFDGSTGTRHSPSKTCDGTGETPLSPIPLQSSSQRYTFPQITLVAENERIASRKLDRTASPSSLWKPRAVVPPHVDRSKYEEIDCKTSWKVDGKEKTVDLSPITKDGCRASHGDNHVEDGQVQRNIESRDTSVDSLAMMNKVTQENEDFKGMVVPFGGGKESQSGSKDLPGADHNGSPREVTEDPKKHELSSNLNLEGGDSGEKREGGGKNDKSEKVFIDVNIRVIIDNGHNTSDRGTGSSERETFANSRYAKDTSDNVVEKDGEQDVGIDAMPTRIDNNAKRISSVDVQNNDLRRKEGNTKIGVDLHKPRGLGTIVEQKMRQDKRAVTCVRRKDTSGAKENITKMLLVVSTMFVALQLPRVVFLGRYFSHYSIRS